LIGKRLKAIGETLGRWEAGEAGRLKVEGWEDGKVKR